MTTAAIATPERGRSDAALRVTAFGAIYLLWGGTFLALRYAAAAVGTYAFVNPLVAVALAWATGDEPGKSRTVIAATLVVAATLLLGQPFAGDLGCTSWRIFGRRSLRSRRGSGNDATGVPGELRRAR